MAADTSDDNANAINAQQAPLRLSHNDLSGRVTGGLVQAHTINDVHMMPAGFIPEKRQAPRQLPPPPYRFVNRVRESELLTRLIVEESAEMRPTVAVLTGISGVGKTATAVYWANANRDKFTGGQLYADLANYRQRGGVEISDVLGGFLRALGVHDGYIPAELAERAAMFRTKTATERLLIVLDNVDQPAHVRALLPGSAESMVLVTSRQRLSGLLVDGAELVEMSPLSADDSSSLLAKMLSENQVNAERDAVRSLVGLCAGLPIALRVAGARLASRRQWTVSGLVRYLSDENHRLGRFSLAGERQVETVFDVAYDDLPASAKRMYCELGLHPGPDFSASAVAAGSNISPDTADESLGVLCEANLVEESGLDRYRFHDLVRLHARQRADSDQPPMVRRRVLRRIVDWYLLGAVAADHAVLGSGRWRLAKIDVTEWKTLFDPASAMSWFEAERANLLAVTRSAAREQWYELVWQLCEALWPLYHGRKHYADWIEAHQLGVEAAVHIGNRVAEARMHNQLARAYLELAEFGRAAGELASAWDAAVDSGSRRAEAVVHESFGLLDRAQRRYPEAIDRFRLAKAINEEMDDQRGAALQLYQLGDVLARSGCANDAMTTLNKAIDLLGDSDDVMVRARIHIVLGDTYRMLGRDDDACHVLKAAATTTRERRQPVKEAEALESLLRVVDHKKDVDLFCASARRLLQIYVENGNPQSKTVRRWIEQQGLTSG